jgi:hypothetical protein
VAHDRFVKAVLTVIALALSVIALRPWLPEPGAVQAQTPMPKHDGHDPEGMGPLHLVQQQQSPPRGARQDPAHRGRRGEGA